MPNSENSRFGRMPRGESKQIRIPKTEDVLAEKMDSFMMSSFCLRVALTTFKNGLDSGFCHRIRGFLRSLRDFLLKEAEGSEGLPNLPSLPFSKF